MIIELIISLIVIYALVIMLLATDSYCDDADYLIVLGCGLINNKMPKCLLDRCDKAIKYLNKHPNTKVVLSGGITEDNSVSEASVMFTYLLSKDINKERIIIEDKSLDTIDNIKYSFALIDKNSKIVIISNDYHLFRTKMIARLFGVKVKGLAVKTELKDLIKHLAIEEVYIIKHYLRIRKGESI